MKIRYGLLYLFVSLYAGLSIAGETPASSPAANAPTNIPTVRQIYESGEAEQLERIAVESGTHQNASTPRSALLAINSALDAGDFVRAAEFMDMRYLPPGIRVEDGPELIKQLRYIFSRHLWVDIASLSDDPEGAPDDGLPSYRDSLGTIETSNGPVHLYLQRIPDGKGGKVWRISNATVGQVPTLWEEYGHSDFAQSVSNMLPPWHALGIDNWQWAYLAVFLLCLVAFVALLSWGLRRYALHSDAPWIVPMQNLVSGPLGIFIYITITRAFMLSLGLSVIARAIFDSVLLEYTAYAFLIIGLVDFFANRIRRKMARGDRPEATAIVRPISAVVKMVLVAIVLIMGLDNAGFDVTTIIAGLGVSSVAVALAAQKTLENLIGAITIYVARPVSPGDFCKFDGVIGTVEEIGLRSTLLRTLDRTIVNIPNALFAAGRIENFSSRESIRYYRMIGLRLSSTPDQLRYVLASLRELLYAHPKILSQSVSVRLSSINDYAYMVRLDSRVTTRDFQQFLAVAEDINLRIVDLVQASGSHFALPSQTVQVEEAQIMDAAQQEQVEALIEQWREQDQLPFPQWSDDYVSKVENTLDYPPRGSVTGHNNPV